MRRRLWIGALVFAALLVFPRTGSAGIGEVILELSGPQFVGGGLECKFTLQGILEQCYAVVPGVAREGSIAKVRRVRLSIEGTGFVSTGKNSNGVDYEFGHIWMLSFDPMLEYVSLERPPLTIYHGFLGASYNLFFGKDFDAFANVALKLRPIGVRIKGVAFEYNIRLYPNRFTPEQFGKTSVTPSTTTTTEAVHSFSFLIPIGKKKS